MIVCYQRSSILWKVLSTCLKLWENGYGYSYENSQIVWPSQLSQERLKLLLLFNIFQTHKNGLKIRGNKKKRKLGAYLVRCRDKTTTLFSGTTDHTGNVYDNVNDFAVLSCVQPGISNTKCSTCANLRSYQSYTRHHVRYVVGDSNTFVWESRHLFKCLFCRIAGIWILFTA